VAEVVAHGRANGVAVEDGDRGDRSQRAAQRLRVDLPAPESPRSQTTLIG
jgi:hypothetical protein